MPIIHTETGLALEAKLIKEYGMRLLWICQDRLVLTDLAHEEIKSIDLFDLVILMDE